MEKAAKGKRTSQSPCKTKTDALNVERKRHLYLMRHGKSEKAGKKGDDVMRPLKKRGRKDVKKIRKLLREKRVQPDLILCSPSVRTMETLEKLKKEFAPTEIVFLDALYTADADGMIRILRQTKPEKREILVIGHNPALQEVLPVICDETEDSVAHNHHMSEGFPTAALACLEVADDWQDLGRHPVRLMNFIYSSDL